MTGSNTTPPGPGSPITRRELILLGLILFLAFGLRVAALLSLKESIYYDTLLWDEQVYHNWAKRLVEGVSGANEVYAFAPLPAYIFAWIYDLTSVNWNNIRVLNIGVGVITCGLVYLIGRELAGRSAGLLSGFVAAIYKPFIFYSIVPMKTAMAVALFAVPIYFLMSFQRREGTLKCCLAGGFLGLALAVRENAVVLLPVIFGLICWHGYRHKIPWPRTAIYGGAFVLCCQLAMSPFLLHNYRISGDIGITGGQAGFNIYIANNTQIEDPYYRPRPWASSSPVLQETQFTIEASRRLKKNLTSDEASSYWIQQTVHEAMESPGTFMLKTWRKALVLVNRFEAGDHYDIPFMSQFVPFLKLPLPGFALIMALGIATLAVLWRRDGRVRTLGILAAGYAATLVIIYTNARYRLPLMTILIPLAAFGILRCWALLRQGTVRDEQRKIHSGLPLADLTISWSAIEVEKQALGKTLTWLLIAGILGVIANMRIYATDDITGFLNTHAIVLDRHGRDAEAVEYWKQSSEMNRPYSAFANMSLAGYYVDKNEMDTVNHYLSLIPDDSFAAASKYESYAAILANQGRRDEAMEAYRRSIGINPGNPSSRRKLMELMGNEDPEALASAQAEYNLVLSFYPESVWN